MGKALKGCRPKRGFAIISQGLAEARQGRQGSTWAPQVIGRPLQQDITCVQVEAMASSRADLAVPRPSYFAYITGPNCGVAARRHTRCSLSRPADGKLTLGAGVRPNLNYAPELGASPTINQLHADMRPVQPSPQASQQQPGRTCVIEFRSPRRLQPQSLAG